jgi:hypothetical protein
MSKKRRKLPKITNTYTVMNELLASPTEPLPLEKRTYQLTRMYEGLRALEMDADPKPEDWRCVSDAVNLMETLVREMRVCDDSSGLLQAAVEALAKSAKRYKCGGALRLDGAGIQAVRSVLDDYATILSQADARTMVRCHRLTERRLIALINGKLNSTDVILKS